MTGNKKTIVEIKNTEAKSRAKPNNQSSKDLANVKKAGKSAEASTKRQTNTIKKTAKKVAPSSSINSDLKKLETTQKKGSILDSDASIFNKKKVKDQQKMRTAAKKAEIKKAETIEDKARKAAGIANTAFDDKAAKKKLSTRHKAESTLASMGMNANSKKGSKLLNMDVKQQEEVTRQMRNQHRLGKSIQGDRTRMAMNQLSIMFMAQAASAALKGMLTSATSAYSELTAGNKNANKGLTMLQANMKYVQFSIGAALSEGLTPYMDEIAAAAEWISDVVMSSPNTLMWMLFGGIALATATGFVAQTKLLWASLKNIITNKASATVINDVGAAMGGANLTNAQNWNAVLQSVGSFMGRTLNLGLTIYAGVQTVKEIKKGNIGAAIGYGIASLLSAAGMVAAFVPGGQVISLALFAAAAVTTGITKIIVNKKDSDEYYDTLEELYGADKLQEKYNELSKEDVVMNKKFMTGQSVLTRELLYNVGSSALPETMRKALLDDEDVQKEIVDSMITKYLDLQATKDRLSLTPVSTNAERQKLTDELADIEYELQTLTTQGAGYFGEMWTSSFSAAQIAQSNLKTYNDELERTKLLTDTATGNENDISNEQSFAAQTAQTGIVNTVNQRFLMGEDVSSADIEKMAELNQQALDLTFDVSTPIVTAFTSVAENEETQAAIKASGVATMDSFAGGIVAGVQPLNDALATANTLMSDNFSLQDIEASKIETTASRYKALAINMERYNRAKQGATGDTFSGDENSQSIWDF